MLSLKDHIMASALRPNRNEAVPFSTFNFRLAWEAKEIRVFSKR